jgi:uncharacterized surface protein with fasciclin (FAS1) repeats
MKRTIYFVILLLVTGYACKKETREVEVLPPAPQLMQVLKTNFQYSIFLHGIMRTGLDKMLDSAGPFTLFVPDNIGFASIGITKETDLDTMDLQRLTTLLQYHIVREMMYYQDIPKTVDNPYRAVNGDTLYVSRPIKDLPPNGSVPLQMTVNGIVVKNINVFAANGVIHVLQNKVLNVPDMTIKDFLLQREDLTHLVTALKKFGLLDQLDQRGPFTVLASNNNSFDYYGLSPDTLNTALYKPFFFSCGILRTRFFVNDFILMKTEENGPSQFNYYTPDGIVTPTPNVVSVNDGYTPLGDYSPQWVSTDHFMSNGVVHIIEGLLIYPENALK